MTVEYDERALLLELEPEAGRLVDRHLKVAQEWFPHEFIPYRLGRDFDKEPWTPDQPRLTGVALGSDGHGIPESHWFATVVLRDAWAAVRQRLAGTVTATWLDQTGESIFEGNARRLYRLPERAT